MPGDARPILFSEEDAYWANVYPEPNSGCWLWGGSLNDKGYGRFHYSGRSEMAHRTALRFICRRIPDNKEVDHLCRVRWCVNPDHLDIVTHRENLLRGNTIAARAAGKTHCQAGHPLFGINLAIKPGGARKCRECDRLRQTTAYQPTTNRRRRKHLNKDERHAILAMISEGKSHSQIAAEINVSISTVSNVRTGKNKYDRPANNI